MEEVLLDLLQRLETLGDECEELYDSEVREALSDAVFAGFIRPQPEYTLPKGFGMYRPGGNQKVRKVLARFLPAARAAAEREGLDTFHKRLTAFQNEEVRTTRTTGYADFFGWWNPVDYDEAEYG